MAGDRSCEKYHKYMEKYHKHLREAEEEARDGDWDDYREEREKASRDRSKAEHYKYLCAASGGCSYRPKERSRDHHGVTTFSYRQQSGRSRGGHGYDRHDSGCSCGSSGRNHGSRRSHGYRRGHGYRRSHWNRHDRRRQSHSPRGVVLRYNNGRFDVVYGRRGRGRCR